MTPGYYRKNAISVDGNLSEDLNDFNLSAGSTYAVSGGQSKYKTLGVFGRVNYDYDGKYLFEASGTRRRIVSFLEPQPLGILPFGFRRVAHQSGEFLGPSAAVVE